MEKLNVAATGRWLSLVCASLGMLISMPRSAQAQSTLTWARVELTRNNVQLYTNGRSRAAKVSDVLGLNDALSTANRSRAELRFNDGSLARIGESAVFRFTPNTRNFRLSNGTVLLLIPPGQGRTTIQTPNAVTGIHGSALFVRFVPETNTTIIGALTNNPAGPMVAFNQDGSAQQPLYAGEMAVLQADGTLNLFSFDLDEFYATSDLMTGLGIDNLDEDTGDAAIDAVRQEIQDALNQQEEFEDGDDVIENPAFLSASDSAPVARTRAIPEFTVSPAAAFLQRDNLTDGFESAVSATVNQPTREQPAQPPARPQTPVTKPTAPSPVVEPVEPAIPEPTIPDPVDPIVKPTAPVEQPAPESVQTPEIVIAPETVVPETTVPEAVAPETTVPETTVPETTVPETTVPETTVPEVINQPIEKPPLPTIPGETTATPTEVIPPTENGFENLGELELIETVTEPETEAQIDRLPETVIVQETPPTAQTTVVESEVTDPGPEVTATPDIPVE
ncbi:MAG: FecR domain-containing protein [Cyanobacteria bacterium P01_A01_bin.137]